MIHRRIPKRLCICPYGCRKSLPLLSSSSHMSVSHWQTLYQSHWQVGLNHRPMQLNHALRTLSGCILNIPLPLDSKVLLWISTLWLIDYDRQLSCIVIDVLQLRVYTLQVQWQARSFFVKIEQKFVELMSLLQYPPVCTVLLLQLDRGCIEYPQLSRIFLTSLYLVDHIARGEDQLAL